ncbi:MAG: hypothetical protein Q4B26_00525 [Eubacteriales bacterium]|nr:hypothetical protein [Eubacteriales bacterium]
MKKFTAIVIVCILLGIFFMNRDKDDEPQLTAERCQEQIDQAYELYKVEYFEPFMEQLREETGLSDLSASLGPWYVPEPFQYNYTYGNYQKICCDIEDLTSNQIHEYYEEFSRNSSSEEKKESSFHSAMDALFQDRISDQTGIYCFDDLEVTVNSHKSGITSPKDLPEIQIYCPSDQNTYFIRSDGYYNFITVGHGTAPRTGHVVQINPTPTPTPTPRPTPTPTHAPSTSGGNGSYPSYLLPYLNRYNSHSSRYDDADDYAAEYADEYASEYGDWDDAYDDGWDEYWDESGDYDD